MRVTLHGARLVDATTDVLGADLTMSDGRIQPVDTVSASATDAQVIDATGMTLIPGFIDVHTHGGGGFNLHTIDPCEILAYADWLPQTGATAFLIGVVGTPDALPEAQLRAAVEAIEQARTGAEPLGIHLEGPYISPLRRGAHRPSWLRTPNPAETEQVLALTCGHLRLLTLAPELPGAPALIRRLVDAGVTVSMGHTDATYEQALEAIQLGVTHATHCCNAMRPLRHRDPGPMAAIAQAGTVRGEIIADGVHVHPAMVSLLVKLLGPERAIIVTDALAGAGCCDAAFEFAGQAARVIDGAARLADGTITGSVLTMDQALRNVVRMTGISLQQAVGMLTVNSARAARVADRKGCLTPGFDADVLVLDDALTLHATYCRGTLAFATEQWQTRVRSSGVIPTPAPAP